MAVKPKHRLLRSVSTILLLVLIGLAVVWWQRNWLYDQIRLYGYNPPAAIAQLADDAAMTDNARHLYYINRPELKARNLFSDFCPSGTEQTVVLGCYKGGQRGIYLLDVTNPELAGIKQVTAAHEMLHAAYQRLSKDDRTYIDGLLWDYYDKQLSNETLKQTIDEYKKTEPGELANEMHSIFATQVADLPTALNTYYQRYFKDRSKVIAFYAGYEKAFTSRQQQIKAYDTQLSDWKTQIDTLENALDDSSNVLASQRSELNQQKKSGNYEVYNAGVDSYNKAVNNHNALLERLKDLINRYNEVVKQRNAIAFEEQSLVQSLTAPAAAQ